MLGPYGPSSGTFLPSIVRVAEATPLPLSTVHVSSGVAAETSVTTLAITGPLLLLVLVAGVAGGSKLPMIGSA